MKVLIIATAVMVLAMAHNPVFGNEMVLKGYAKKPILGTLENKVGDITQASRISFLCTAIYMYPHYLTSVSSIDLLVEAAASAEESTVR